MPTPTATNEDVMAALNAMTKTVSDCMTAVTAALTAKANPPPAPSEEMKALKTSLDTLTTQSKQNEEKLAALVTENTKMKRERQLLGFRGTPEERAKLGSATDDVIRDTLAKQKSFHQMCRETRETLKCTAQIAAQRVMRTPEGRAAYRADMLAKGIIKPEDDPAVAAGAN